MRLDSYGVKAWWRRTSADVRAARYWIEAGNVGVVTFDACCAWLGWDAEHARETILSTVRAA